MTFKKIFVLLLLAGLFTSLSDTAVATQYTYTPGNATSDTWSTGTDWNATPVSASTTELTIVGANSTVLASGLANTNTNNDTGNFQLDILDLQGTGPSSGTGASITIAGNPLDFVSNGATTPVINLNALKGSEGVAYIVSNNIILGANTAVDGNGTGTFTFTGLLSGTGNLTKSGTSTLSLGIAGTVNGGFANYTGNIDVTGGSLSFAGGTFLSGGSLTIGTGTVTASGANGSTSGLGFSGLYGSGVYSGGPLFIDYNGAATDTFTGSLTPTAGGNPSIFELSGSGNVTLTGVPTVGELNNDGDGTLTAPGVSSSTSVEVAAPFSTIELTGTNTGTAISFIRGGTLWIAPSGSNSLVTVAGSTTGFRIGGGGTLKLDKGSNTDLVFTIGSASGGTPTAFTRIGLGNLVIDPASGTLGGTTRFIVLDDTGAGIPLTSTTVGSTGIIAPNVVTSVNGGSADFLTYSGTGLTTDTGLEIDPNYATSFSGSNTNSVIKITSATSLTGSTLAYAIRDDSTINLAGNTLTMDGGTSASFAGLILNGGTISGSGTVAFGSSEADIYVSNANGTIGSNITTSGALVKFGPGTLYLTGTNTFSSSSGTLINSGAIDIGSSSGNGNGSLGVSNVILDGGVLEGYGTFTRSLAGGNNGIYWGDDNTSDASAGGGFSANGGTFTINLGNLSSPSTLTWGSALFLPDSEENGATYVAGSPANVVGGVLMFGSATANNQVIFENNINLGSGTGGNLDYREINVNPGTGNASADLSGVISSTDPHGLLKTGAGALLLSNSTGNTYTAGTVVSAGTLQISNSSGSATGSGSLTVNAGATLAGTGISSGSSFNISGTGTTASARANVLVGQIPTGIAGGSANTTNTTNTMTLIGTGASTFANANLTFNLNSAVAGGLGANPANSGNELAVGNTAILFGAGAQSVTLTLNLQGNSIIAENTAYVLIAGTAVGTSALTSQYSGLTFGTSTGTLATGLTTQILGSGNGGIDNLTLALSGGAADYYGANSFLFLYQNSSTGVDDIEVEMVPEPGTWAMMLGGLTLLIFWQRRRQV